MHTSAFRSNRKRCVQRPRCVRHAITPLIKRNRNRLCWLCKLRITRCKLSKFHSRFIFRKTCTRPQTRWRTRRYKSSHMEIYERQFRDPLKRKTRGLQAENDVYEMVELHAFFARRRPSPNTVRLRQHDRATVKQTRLSEDSFPKVIRRGCLAHGRWCKKFSSEMC